VQDRSRFGERVLVIGAETYDEPLQAPVLALMGDPESLVSTLAADPTVRPG
jgi:hypothetical protein